MYISWKSGEPYLFHLTHTWSWRFAKPNTRRACSFSHPSTGSSHHYGLYSQPRRTSHLIPSAQFSESAPSATSPPCALGSTGFSRRSTSVKWESGQWSPPAGSSKCAVRRSMCLRTPPTKPSRTSHIPATSRSDQPSALIIATLHTRPSIFLPALDPLLDS